MTQTTRLLVADVGGTNTRVALADGAVVDPSTIARFRNDDYADIAPVLQTYLAQQGQPEIQGACVAIAGPVRDSVGALTNRDWSIDLTRLMGATGALRGDVLNDLQAQGYALGAIAPEQSLELVAGKTPAGPATQLVLGVGTGFNMAAVFETPAGRFVPPAEAGHVNLPIRSEAELSLCHFVESAHGFPAIEDVLSGRGLERVYAWLASEAGDPQERTAAEIMQSVDTDPRAEAAVRQFVAILGAVAGNLALIQLPFGGIYLVGGVARAVAPYFDRFGFEQAFRDKGRFSGFMQNFAVHMVTDDYAALTGCAAHLNDICG